MSIYSIAREIQHLTTKELLLVFANEIFKRVKEKQEELKELTEFVNKIEQKSEVKEWIKKN